MRALPWALAMAAILAPGAPGTASERPYEGLEARAIAALSEGDVAALRAGNGWGLALPAELNGWPGPRHVLDLGEELGLSEVQRVEVEAIFVGMQARARALGPDYIAAEQALDAAFAQGDVDAAALTALLGEAERLRAALRETHLAAHLATRPLLSRHQIMTYDRLRGYGGEGGHGGGHGHGHGHVSD